MRPSLSLPVSCSVLFCKKEKSIKAKILGEDSDDESKSDSDKDDSEEEGTK